MACDIATRVGISYAMGDDKPVYGSARMGKPGCSIGEVFITFDAWMQRRLERLQPKIFIFEEPALINRGSVMVNYRLMGMVALAETLALKHGCRVYQAASATVCLHFTGRGRYKSSALKKEATIKACQLRGWNPLDDDSADSLALLDYAQSLLNRERLVQRAAGELFTGGSR